MKFLLGTLQLILVCGLLVVVVVGLKFLVIKIQSWISNLKKNNIKGG